jgi:hypothetical protein
MFRRPLLRLLLGATLALAACNSDSSNSGDDSPPGTPDASVAADGALPGPDAFVPPADSYSLTWGPVTVPSGQEDTQCVTLDLANLSALHIGQIHNVLTGGSHHLIVYRTTDPVAPMAPCTPFSGTLHPDVTSPLMITQRHDETLELPQGVAFTFGAAQHIRLEMHFINTTDGPLDVKGTSTFIPLADADFQQEADFLFIGTPDINIAAGESKTVGPVYFPAQPSFSDANFFAMTGHTHRYGVNVHVAKANGSADPGTPIYEHANWLWSEPETEYYDPTFKLPSGGGFRFSCEYKNTGTSSVSFGESANDEMCFFWAYYYPSTGPHVCIHTTRFGGAFDGCCPDLPALCSAIDGFLSNN